MKSKNLQKLNKTLDSLIKKEFNWSDSLLEEKLKYSYDYQNGYCHYFAPELRKQLKKILPNEKIEYKLLLGWRYYRKKEDNEDVLIHTYVKIGDNILIDSEGFNYMSVAEERVDEWCDEQDCNVGVKDKWGHALKDYDSEFKDSDEIPDNFYHSYDLVKPNKVKADVKKFIESKVFCKFIKEYNKTK